MFLFHEVIHALSSDDESNEEKITWLTCAGQLENLSKFSYQCQYVLEEARLDNTKAEAFVVKAKEIALKMSDLAQKLVRNCSFPIEIFAKKSLQ